MTWQHLRKSSSTRVKVDLTFCTAGKSVEAWQRALFHNRCKIDKKIELCAFVTVSAEWKDVHRGSVCTHIFHLYGCAWKRSSSIGYKRLTFFMLSLSAENPGDRNIYYTSCWCLVGKPTSYFSHFIKKQKRISFSKHLRNTTIFASVKKFKNTHICSAFIHFWNFCTCINSVTP